MKKQFLDKGNQRGITLIVLIITIIIMLTLTAVIVDVTIDGHLIDSAKVAVKESNNKENQIEGKINEWMKEIDNIENTWDYSGVLQPTNLTADSSLSFSTAYGTIDVI